MGVLVVITIPGNCVPCSMFVSCVTFCACEAVCARETQCIHILRVGETSVSYFSSSVINSLLRGVMVYLHMLGPKLSCMGTYTIVSKKCLIMRVW